LSINVLSNLDIYGVLDKKKIGVYTSNMKIISVNIKKPIYGNYVYINSSIVERAIRTGAQLEIIIPAGRTIVDPKVWKKTGKIMKKIFNFPSNPMILYGNSLQIPTIKGQITTLEKEKEEAQKLKLF